MAGGKYAGVLRSRTKVKARMRLCDFDYDQPKDGRRDPGINLTTFVQRLIAEIERREFVELHCINLESLFRSRLLSLIREACRVNGIFYVTCHEIRTDLLQDMQRLASVFFSLPSDKKSQSLASTSFGGRKKIQYNETSNGQSLKIKCGASALYKMDWPTEPAIFSKVMAEYLVQHQELCVKMLRLLSRSLGMADNGLFSTCFEPFTVMTIRSYSPAPHSILPTTVDEGAHSSVLTMTFPDDTGGLQIFSEGRWLDIKSCEGAILISVGDQLRILSDGQFKSSLYRVVASKFAGRVFVNVSFCASKEFIADLEQLAPSQNKDCLSL